MGLAVLANIQHLMATTGRVYVAVVHWNDFAQLVTDTSVDPVIQLAAVADYDDQTAARIMSCLPTDYQLSQSYLLIQFIVADGIWEGQMFDRVAYRPMKTRFTSHV